MSATFKSIHQKYTKLFAGMNYHDNEGEIRHILRRDGFKKIARYKAFVRGNCVVKFSLLLTDAPPKKAVKSYISKMGIDDFVTQPLCDHSESAQNKAYSSLLSERDWEDFAPRNCGIYKGKAVIFDW